LADRRDVVLSRSVRLFTVVAISLAAGTVSAVQAVKAVPEVLHRSGPWLHVSGAAFDDSDPYAVLRRHLSDDAPMGAGEGVVVAASVDSAGMALNSACDYRVSGRTPIAKLFTFALRRADGGLPQGDAPRPAALHSEQMIFGRDAYVIDISSEGRSGNWLASEQTPTPFLLVMRLYETSIAGPSGMQSLDLPVIRREACRDA
jgi:hypothetical protein